MASHSEVIAAFGSNIYNDILKSKNGTKEEEKMTLASSKVHKDSRRSRKGSKEIFEDTHVSENTTGNSRESDKVERAISLSPHKKTLQEMRYETFLNHKRNNIKTNTFFQKLYLCLDEGAC